MIEDDFSRFVVGHVLADGPTSEVVVAAIRDAIRLHGKHERVYTDRCAAFMAWRDVTSCEVFLDEQLIDLPARSCPPKRVVASSDRRLVPAAESEVIARLKRGELSPPQKGLRSIEPRSMLDQLVALGVFLRDPDGRCNVPDLYRVAMDMKRRGRIRLAR